METNVINPVLAISAVPLQDNGKELNWQPGHLFEGKVMAQLTETTYSIVSSGKKIILNSPQALTINSSIWLEVQGKKEGQYLVSILMPQELQNDQQNEIIFKDLMMQLSMPDNPTNRALIQGLIKAKMPLKPEILQEALKAVQALGKEGLDTVEKAVLALKFNMPTQTKVLDALISFLSQSEKGMPSTEEQLVSFMGRLQNTLSNISAKNQQISNIPPVYSEQISADFSTNGEKIFQAIGKDLQSFVLRPEEGALKISQQLRETMLLQLPTVMPTKVKAFSPLLVKMSQLLELVGELTAKNNDIGVGREKLLQAGADILQQMVGKEIFQSVANSQREENYLYFNLPFIQNGENKNFGQLRVIKDGKNKQLIDSDNFKMSLFLNTENMGNILLDLKVHDKKILVNGKVRNENVIAVFQKAWPLLQDRLQLQGYLLQSCRWKIGLDIESIQPKSLQPIEQKYQLSRIDTIV